MALTDKQITTSLLNWFSTNYAGNIDWDAPAKFDHEADSLESWVQAHVDMIRPSPRRRTGLTIAKIQFVLHCYARTQSNMFAAATVAATITELIEHEVVAIQNFEDSAEPTVGYACLLEPKMEEVDSPDEQNWKAYRVVVEGLVQEI